MDETKPTNNDAERLARETQALRSQAQRVMQELIRRRDELFDIRLQAKRHRVALGVVGAAVLGLASAGIAFTVMKGRRDRKPLVRARKIGQALARIAAHPERVAQPKPSIARKIALTLAMEAAAVVVKAILQKRNRPNAEPGRVPASV